MTRCAQAMGAGQRSYGAGSRANHVMPEPMAALHRLRLKIAHAQNHEEGQP